MKGEDEKIGDLLELSVMYNCAYLVELVSTSKWAARQDISTTLCEDLTCKGKTCAMMLICSPPPVASIKGMPIDCRTRHEGEV